MFCLENKVFHLVLAPKIRLSSTYEGSIQIKDGSKWRYVKEENWDKLRQNMLCQYLGFSGKGYATRHTLSSSGYNFYSATGHLICHKRQSKGLSCCVHVTRSTNENSITLPYARCKCAFMIFIAFHCFNVSS